MEENSQRGIYKPGLMLLALPECNRLSSLHQDPSACTRIPFFGKRLFAELLSWRGRGAGCHPRPAAEAKAATWAPSRLRLCAGVLPRPRSQVVTQLYHCPSSCLVLSFYRF